MGPRSNANVGGQGSDTDAVVQPMPQGAEISYLLRSAASPESDVLSFDLPAGWVLHQAADRSGAVEIVSRANQVVGTVLPPSAMDAQGETVPVSYEVRNGDQLVVDVSHHSGSFAYPIVVDPLVADYTAGGEVDWSHVQSGGSFTASTSVPAYFDTSTSGGAGLPGGVSTWEMKASTSYTAGAYAEFRKAAPAGAYIYKPVDTGVVHRAYQSLEFGGIEENNGSTWEPGTWQRIDPTNGASGIIDMGAREYIPELGRFLQVDPVAGGSANAYDYANQDW